MPSSPLLSSEGLPAFRMAIRFNVADTRRRRFIRRINLRNVDTLAYRFFSDLTMRSVVQIRRRGVHMIAISKSFTEVVSRIGSLLTSGGYHVTQRADWSPYLGHVPYFAPKAERRK